MQISNKQTVASSRLKFLFLIVPLILSFYAVQAQSSFPRVIAEIFECDDDFKPIDPMSTPPRQVGHEFHICIEPNLPTRHRNVRMRSIDRFGFLAVGSSTSQVIIDNGMETDQTLTLLLCVPGSLTCSFKTTIIPEFFSTSSGANITGFGEVTMQMTEEGYRGRHLTKAIRGQTAWRVGQPQDLFDWNDEIDERRHRRGQSIEGDFAGEDEVEIMIPIELTDNPVETTTVDTDDVDGTWWEEAPNWVRPLFMAFAMLFLLILLCIICYCMFARLFRVRKEPTTKSSSPRNAPFPVKTLEFTEECEETERSSNNKFGHFNEEPEVENRNVYFDSVEQPGTIAFYKALDKTIKKFKGTEYCPEIYRHVKRQLPDRRFYFFDFEDEDADGGESGEWTELSKKELVTRIKEEFEDRRAEKESELNKNKVSNTQHKPSTTASRKQSKKSAKKSRSQG